MAKDIRCRLGSHRWRKPLNKQREWYLNCQRCGEDHDPASQLGWGTAVNNVS